MAARTALLIFMIDERFGVFSKRAQKHRPPPEKRSPAAGVFVFSFAALYEKAEGERAMRTAWRQERRPPVFRDERNIGKFGILALSSGQRQKAAFCAARAALLRTETACDFQMIFTACRDNSRCTNRRLRSCTSSSSSSRAARCERRCSGRSCRIRCSAS